MKIGGILEVEKNIIYEAIVTTSSDSGGTNIAPMGVIFTGEDSFLLRPFTDTTTYRNLREQGEGVVNITRNPEHFILSILPPLRKDIALEDSRRVKTSRLKDAEAYLEFIVEEIMEDGGRAEVSCKIIEAYRGGELIQPYSRAAYALIEAAIAATRVRVFLGRERRLIELLDDIERCRRTVVRVASEGRFRTLLERLLEEVRRMIGHASST